MYWPEDFTYKIKESGVSIYYKGRRIAWSSIPEGVEPKQVANGLLREVMDANPNIVK